MDVDVVQYRVNRQGRDRASAESNRMGYSVLYACMHASQDLLLEISAVFFVSDVLGVENCE